MRPWVGDPGHVVWRDHADRVPEIDVLPAHRWPLGYPSLEGLVARSSDGDGALPVAAPEDRLLIFAADALAGRPVAGLAARARDLLEDPDVLERLEAVAAGEGLMALAALISEPDRLVARARRGRLTYGTAARAAVQSPAARAALRSRLASRLGLRPRGLLVALSGMDGAGKSTLAGEVVAALEEGGVPATTAWARFGQEAATLDALAGPVKRLIPRRGTVADPIAAGGPGGQVAGPRGDGGAPAPCLLDLDPPCRRRQRSFPATVGAPTQTGRRRGLEDVPLVVELRDGGPGVMVRRSRA